MKSVIVLGRQPALGLAELESVFGADKLRPTATPEVIELDIEPADIRLDRLGGSVKAAKLLTCLETTDWREISRYLFETSPGHAQYVPEGKLKIGLSAYGFKLHTSDLYRTGIELKKAIKAEGRSVRIVPNTMPALSSAQVLHNQLAGENGWELLIIRDDRRTILAQTTAVQDIEAYAGRDQARPMRDARVGMLPPKLAQIIVNLAAGSSAPQSDADPAQYPTILDPFCGTGVILQEALLMGYSVYGSDLDPRMMEYSRQNLDWLTSNEPDRDWQIILETGDATTHKWSRPFQTVAAEVYLGQPLTSLPSADKLDPIMRTCDTILRKFLQNLAPQIPSGRQLCLAVPTWRSGSSFLHLKILDKLKDLGYKRLSFNYVLPQDLIYHREDQTVARELVVLQKI